LGAGAVVRQAPRPTAWYWPHVNLEGMVMPNDGDLLDLMLEWVPEEATRNRIPEQNPNQLYGF
jgi:2-pyrone-4,6-dicarboxylate lactonase